MFRPRSLLARAGLAVWALLLAIGGGAASVHWALDRMATHPTTAGWTPVPGGGPDAADPYEAAILATTGRLPLGRAEGIAFVAHRDESGDKLLRECAYRLKGPLPPGRFWTLRAADADLAPLVLEGARPATLHALQALRGEDGALDIAASALPSSGNWLRLGGTGPLAFILTLYDPTASGSFAQAETALPTVSKVACDG
ncbi:MAG: DUF1214 domain-containing protein [Mesorhizobium amorphae]|nr:MAG: DUF1214 domain-containing protein [Mesorhizobium amorphae]